MPEGYGYAKNVTPKSESKGNHDKDGHNCKDILTKARERARDGATYWKDNWDAAEDDLKFLAGEQWPSQVRTERELEQRPCLVNDVLNTFVDQVTGDQRQNRPSIKVAAVDMQRVPSQKEDEESESLKITSETGNKDYELAEVFTGVIKNIEYNCDAETSYDIAFQAAVESGIGFLRVRSDYESDDSFEQELIIDHIENQFSVTMDPGARERDRSDMNWCLVDDLMQKDEFESKYPNATSDPVASDSVDEMGTWYTDNTVKVSEYFTREEVVREMCLFSDNSIMWKDEIKEKGVDDDLENAGIKVVRTRKVKTYKVMWRKITGLDILEGPIELPCTTIPIVPVWGKCATIKKKIIFRSLIRHSKDAQRMANYWDSAQTEVVALAPKAPFVGTVEHIEGYEDEWENANTTNSAMLPYNSQYQGDPGPRRQPTAAVPAAEITLGMSSSEKIKQTIGMSDASKGMSGDEASGKAIIARQRQGDRGSFAFIDNLSKSIRRIGKLLVEMIPQVYDTERVMRLKFSDETEDYVTLNKQIEDKETGEWVTIHDLSVSKYDVVVTTGPAYLTQRTEAAESMMRFAQSIPEAAAIIPDLIALNLDIPGSDVMSQRLKKMLPPNVLTEEERKKVAEDTPEPEPQPPTPEQQVEMAEIEARTVEAQAEVSKSKATIEKAEADIVISQLKVEEAKISATQTDTEGGVSYDQIKAMVASALAESINEQEQQQGAV